MMIMGSLREGVLRGVYNPIIPSYPYGSLRFPKAPGDPKDPPLLNHPPLRIR